MNIKLINNWKIKSDKHQYILVREENNREFVEGYYSSLESCIQDFVDMKIRGSNATSIFSLLQSIKTLQTQLNKALQPLKLEVKPLSKAETKEKNPKDYY